MGQIGSLESFNTSLRTYGFSLNLNVRVFCFVVLIHVGVPGILAPKLGIKVYYRNSFNIFLSAELLFLKR